MALANLGSIATNILTRTSDIPTNISGALITIVDEERLFVEQKTGLTIGSTNIDPKYQPAITDLATAKVLELMQLQGGDFTETSLGEFSIKKGEASNLTIMSQQLRQNALQKLRSLGTKINFSRSIGGN